LCLLWGGVEMGLRETIQQDLHAAMRARDEHRKAALRMILLGIQLAESDSETGSLSDEEIIRIIEKEIRRREGALELVRQAGREDIIAEDEQQLTILRAYMPPQLDAETLTELAREVIAQVGATSAADIGKIMPLLLPQVKGKADGRMVNQIVRGLLSQ